MCVQNKVLDLQKHVQQQRKDFPNFPTLQSFCPLYNPMGGGIQVQNFVFLTSELKSTHNFSVENMFYSYFWDTSYIHTFGSQVGVRSQTLSYIVLFCLFVSSATWDTQSETIHVASVYNLFASTGPFQFPPDNRQKWGVWVPLLRTLLCMLRDEVLQIK